jgi:hypothetical protein
MQDSQRWSFSCGPQSPRFAQYLAAVQQLDQLAQNRFGKHVVSAGDLLDDRSRHHYRAWRYTDACKGLEGRSGRLPDQAVS